MTKQEKINIIVELVMGEMEKLNLHLTGYQTNYDMRLNYNLVMGDIKFQFAFKEEYDGFRMNLGKIVT